MLLNNIVMPAYCLKCMADQNSSYEEPILLPRRRSLVELTGSSKGAPSYMCLDHTRRARISAREDDVRLSGSDLKARVACWRSITHRRYIMARFRSTEAPVHSQPHARRVQYKMAHTQHPALKSLPETQVKHVRPIVNGTTFDLSKAAVLS